MQILVEIKYDRHKEDWEDCLSQKDRIKFAESWMKSGTFDKWRHERMLKKILPFINEDLEWLTIGDGRYGTDANFIIRN